MKLNSLDALQNPHIVAQRFALVQSNTRDRQNSIDPSVSKLRASSQGPLGRGRSREGFLGVGLPYPL